MASAALRMNRQRRKKPPQLVVIHGGRELSKEHGNALSLSVSDRFRARQLQRRLDRAGEGNPVPERHSVAIAMLAVEERLVKAFWVIARQPAKDTVPIISARCGIDYIPERSDFVGYADAAGGKWHSIAPRPPIPSGKEIDEAAKTLDWLLYVDEARRKILVAGATSKRGDAGRQINWGRLRECLSFLDGLSTRTLQGRYREALRIVVSELTLARLAM